MTLTLTLVLPGYSLLQGKKENISCYFFYILKEWIESDGTKQGWSFTVDIKDSDREKEGKINQLNIS